MSWWSLSWNIPKNKIKSNYGYPKKIKDGMPKKHGPKKMGNHVGKKGNDKRERTNALRSTTIHLTIHPHNCTFWLRLHDLFLHGSFLWLYNIWNASMECKYGSFLTLPWAPQNLLSTVGKAEGRYCPCEDNKSWVLRENNFGELSHIF